MIDGEGTVMLASAHLERELGSRTLVGASLVNLIHPDDYPDFIGTLVSFVADVGVVTWSDWRFRHANGGWVEMETTATNLLADPSVHGIVLTSRNVTERNATNRTLEEARRRLEAVLDIAGAAIFVTELDGTIALANRACSTLFGLQPEEMLGRRAVDLLGPDEARQMEVHGRETLRAGVVQQFDEYIEIDGDSRHFLSTKVPIFDADGTPTGLCSVATDITDRARAQKEREVAQDGPGPLTAHGRAGPARRRRRARLQQPAGRDPQLRGLRDRDDRRRPPGSRGHGGDLARDRTRRGADRSATGLQPPRPPQARSRRRQRGRARYPAATRPHARRGRGAGGHPLSAAGARAHGRRAARAGADEPGAQRA